jgi:hypothetical protein
MLVRLYLKKQATYGEQACNPLYVGGGGWRITVQDWPRKSTRPFLKNKAKRAGDTAQAGPEFKPSYLKKKKKKKKVTK